MNDKLVDFIFKVLAAGTVPALIWVNSLSIQNAVLETTVSNLDQRVSDLEVEQKRVSSVITENQASLREVHVTVKFIKDLLVEIRGDLRRDTHAN
jgi:hypothetical protein